jgi:hypothetical protein
MQVVLHQISGLIPGNTADEISGRLIGSAVLADSSAYSESK